MTIPDEHSQDLYRFTWKEVTNMKSRLLRVGGIQNHVHMLIDLHPSVSLSQLMQNVKGRSSGWMRSDDRFCGFNGWASEYYGCTISPEQKHAVIEYIKGQQQHHLGAEFNREVVSMYRYADLDYHPSDLM